MALIEIENVSRIYAKNFAALQNVTCSIEKGEFISIVGSSGAGKSTLLKLMYAEELATSGRVLFDGRDLV